MQMDKHTATEQAFKNGYSKGYEAGKKDAMAELVRCKDCKHYHKRVCPMWMYTEMKPKDFCSYGERRE